MAWSCLSCSESRYFGQFNASAIWHDSSKDSAKLSPINLCNELPPGDGTAVGQITGEIEVDAVAGDQRAGGREVAGLHAYVDLRDEDLLRRAVGQLDGLLDQPDDVGGQRGHLCGRQGNAGDEVPGPGNADAGVHQRLVLGFIAGISGEKTAAGELGDLFVDQALLVKTVAQALLAGGDRETIDYDPLWRRQRRNWRQR